MTRKCFGFVYDQDCRILSPMRPIAQFPALALFFLLSVLLAAACDGGGNLFGVESELVTPAKQADALAFAPDGRLFYAEHWTGSIRIVTADGELLPDPFATITDIAPSVGWGLTGLALDPEFETNHYVYVYFTQLVDPGPPLVARPAVIRFTDQNNQGVNRRVIIGDLPEADPELPFGANGSIHFGPDGFLYITLGDYDLPVDEMGPQGQPLPQDLGTPISKVLRVDKKDGSAPPDNPFVDEADADPRIFAYGFQEPFNFTFHPQSGQMYGSDSTRVTCEELNIIEAGANYGWPEGFEWPYTDCLAGKGTQAIHLFARSGMQPNNFDSAVAIAGLEFVSGDDYPLLDNSLLVCESSTQLMRRLVLAGTNSDEGAEEDVVVEDCWFDITTSPDGIIYYSNLTEIRRLLPAE